MENKGVAARGTTAADLGAWVCFEDECGRTMRPPTARTTGARGLTPVVRVPGRREGGVSVAALACHRPGVRSRLIYRIPIHRRRKSEAASFTRRDHRDLIVMAHVRLGTPIVPVRDNLNRHICPDMQRFIAGNADWPRVFQLPSYAPDLNPVEGIWSLLNRSGLASLAAANLDHLVRAIKRGLKRIQYRPHPIDGCLAGTDLALKSS